MPTVLCIDDHTYDVAAAIELLRANGYRVVTVKESSEALGLIRMNYIDAVFLNCHLNPDKSTDIIPLIRKLASNVAIIMMSGCCAVPCQKLQTADACIQKGDTGRALLVTLDVLLRCRLYGLCRSLAA